MARGALMVKKGAALVFADGTRGVASSDDYMGLRERIVAIGGEVRPNERSVPTCGRCAAAVARLERKG